MLWTSCPPLEYPVSTCIAQGAGCFLTQRACSMFRELWLWESIHSFGAKSDPLLCSSEMHRMGLCPIHDRQRGTSKYLPWTLMTCFFLAQIFCPSSWPTHPTFPWFSTCGSPTSVSDSAFPKHDWSLLLPYPELKHSASCCLSLVQVTDKWGFAFSLW